MMSRLASAALVACALIEAVPFWDHLAQSTDLNSDRGSRLLMIVLDATGDGRPEIFIAPEGLCGNGGCAWSVYSPTGRPREVRYLGEAGFAPGAYRFDPVAHVLSYCWHMSAASCGLGEYRFTPAAMQHRDLGECLADDAACEKRLDEIRAWQRASAPPIFEATIAKDDALEGLRWTAQRSRSDLSVVPELDRLVVVDGSMR